MTSKQAFFSTSASSSLPSGSNSKVTSVSSSPTWQRTKLCNGRSPVHCKHIKQLSILLSQPYLYHQFISDLFEHQIKDVFPSTQCTEEQTTGIFNTWVDCHRSICRTPNKYRGSHTIDEAIEYINQTSHPYLHTSPTMAPSQSKLAIRPWHRLKVKSMPSVGNLSIQCSTEVVRILGSYSVYCVVARDSDWDAHPKNVTLSGPPTMVTLAGYCVHSTPVPAIAPKTNFAK
jgi:hypothetical protein